MDSEGKPKLDDLNELVALVPSDCCGEFWSLDAVGPGGT